jgi:pyrroloquinoline quinone (PQQ) biosynthesis protein C
LPWDPDANEISEQEYQNKELNALMKSYKENVSRKDEFFRERKEEKLKEALDKNKTAKRVSGEEKETLDKVRRTIVEKNEILQKVKDSESKSESKEEPSETTFQNVNTSKEEISSLFDTPDPWMQTKMNKKE